MAHVLDGYTDLIEGACYHPVEYAQEGIGKVTEELEQEGDVLHDIFDEFVDAIGDLEEET